MLFGRLVGPFESVPHENLGGLDSVVRLEFGEITIRGVVEEIDDGLSAVCLLADDFSEGLEAGVLYVIVWAV